MDVMDVNRMKELEELGIELETTTTISSTSSTNTTKNQFMDRIRAASQSLQAGDYANAIRLYTEALKLDEHNYVLYGNRSAAYCRIGKFTKALQDAIKARELNPNWSKAYYRQGIAFQCLRRYSDALAAFASGLAQDSKSVQLLSGFVETAMKSPLRATLEPTYRQLQVMNFDKSPFVITSVVGQDLLASGHYAAAVVVLESSLKIGSCSLKLRGSVFSALSSAYWALNNLDKAISYMQQDLQVAKSLGDSLGECRAHGNLGSAYFAKCNYKEALASHRYQLVLAMKGKHTPQAALALTSLGHVYSAIGDINNALASHKQCLQLVRQIGDPLAEAREIGNVGAVYLASGDFEKAIECHLEHVKLAKLLGNKAEEARAYSNLGSAHHYRRNYEQAIQFHEQVLRISQEIGDRTIEAKAFAGLGHASRCMGDLLQAKRWHERQLDIALAMKDKLGEGRACSNLGIVYQLLGDFDGALKLHWSHLTISKHLNDSGGMGRAYGNIGNAYSSLKQYEEAIKYHKQELQISKEVHDRGAEASTHGNLAIAYQALGMCEMALTHYHLHLNVAKEMKDCNSEACALCNLGNYHSSRHEFDKAISYYELYFELTRNIGDIEGEAKACHFLGYAYYCLQNYTKAIEYYDRDLHLSKEMQDRINMGRAYCNLGLAHLSLGNYNEALDCQKYFLCTSQGNPVNKLRAMSNIGDVLTQMKQINDAMKMFEKQLSLARSLGDVTNEANAFTSLGNCQKYAGNYEKAILYYKQELMFRQTAGDLQGEVNALGSLGDTYIKCNNYSLALKCFMDQLDKSSQLNDNNLSSITALENVATTRMSMSHFEEAIGYFEQQISLLDTFESSNKCHNNRKAKSHCHLGDCYHALNDNEEAIKCYANYLSLSTSTADQEKAYRSLGKCYQLVNNLSQALVAYEKRLVLAHELGCNSTKAIAYGELGHIHRQLGNYEQAITCFKHEQELAKDPSLKDGLIEAEALHGLGCVAQEMHDCERALKYHSSALAIAQEISSLQLESRAYGAIGNAYETLGNYESAIKYQEKHLSVAHIVGDRRAQVNALSSLGRIHSATNHFSQAINYLQQALAITEQLANKREEEAKICHDLGMALWSINDLSVAESHLQRSVDLLEAQQRHDSSGKRDEHHLQSYEALCKVLIALNRHNEALIIAERSRTRPVINEKQGFRLSSITTSEQMIDMSKGENAAILYYSLTSDGIFNAWLITPTGIKFSQIPSDKLSQLLSNVRESIQSEPNIDDSEVSESMSLRMHLNRNHYLNSSNYSLSSLFSLASSVASNSTTGSRQGSLIKRCTNRWQGSTSVMSLYNLLLSPFEKQLDLESSLSQLLLVLDGDLFLVPWNMLKNDSEEFLCERFSLLILPSLVSLRGDQRTKALRKSPSSSTITSLVVANPTLPQNISNKQLYSDNPSAAQEVTLVGELLSTRPLIGNDANKEVVLSQLSSAQCIHFSTHIIDNTNNDSSKMMTSLGIALSPSDVLMSDQSSQNSQQLQESEYLLSPNDIINIGLSAKLVVISCCATNRTINGHSVCLGSTFNSCESLRTITSSILTAGANCVLLSLWPVPLSSLQILYRVFYSSLLQGTRVSTALNEAIATIQNTSQFSHPTNWAGFLLIGSDIRLSSQVALMSSSLASLLKSPERSRDALRVILHLVEKSLQRIQRGYKNAMYTTLQSIENKVGSALGWRELLISVGFRFEPSSVNGLPACVFFPQSDPGDRLVHCSSALQAILALTPVTITAISKLLNTSDCVSDIIEQLRKVVHQHSRTPDCSSLPSVLETLQLKLWSVPGCHELFASLGFDLMEVGSNSVTLRTGKHANKRTICFALQALLALFDTKEMTTNQNNSDSIDVSSDETTSSDDESQTLESKTESMRNSAFSIYHGRGEPDGQQNGQQNGHKNNGHNSNCVYSSHKTATIVSVHIPPNHVSNGITSFATKRSDSSSSTGSVTDWDSGLKTVHRRSDYLSRKQLQLSVNKSSLDIIDTTA